MEFAVVLMAAVLAVTAGSFGLFRAYFGYWPWKGM